MIFYLIGYYLLAGLAINLAYHRVLSHRSLQIAKPLEYVLVTLGLPAGTPVQWAGNHRFHHAHADEAIDPHSPNQKGFWYGHVGWYIGTANPVLCMAYSLAGPFRTLFDAWHRPRTNQEHNALAADVSADPYYRWISRPGPYAVACVLHVGLFFGVASVLAGWSGLGMLFLASVLVYNVGDAIDSVSHLIGRAIPGTVDRARNHGVMGWLALGEGWHANHHALPFSARHGLLPGQFDWTWQVIRVLQRLGMATKIRLPEPQQIQSLRDAGV